MRATSPLRNSPKLNAWRATKTLFADYSDLAAYRASGDRGFVCIHIGGARPHGGDNPGKLTSVELLTWRGAGYDVCGRDSPSHGPLSRALRESPVGSPAPIWHSQMMMLPLTPGDVNVRLCQLLN